MLLSPVLRQGMQPLPTLLLQYPQEELPIDWFTAFMHRFSISTLLGAWPVALGWKGDTGKTEHKTAVNLTLNEKARQRLLPLQNK